MSAITNIPYCYDRVLVENVNRHMQRHKVKGIVKSLSDNRSSAWLILCLSANLFLCSYSPILNGRNLIWQYGWQAFALILLIAQYVEFHKKHKKLSDEFLIETLRI